MITGERMSEQIRGERFPETEAEYLLIEFYAKGLLDELLLTIVLSQSNDFDKRTSEELRMALYGYALGQKHYDERIAGFELEKLNPSSNDDVH